MAIEYGGIRNGALDILVFDCGSFHVYIYGIRPGASERPIQSLFTKPTNRETMLHRLTTVSLPKS